MGLINEVAFRFGVYLLNTFTDYFHFIYLIFLLLLKLQYVYVLQYCSKFSTRSSYDQRPKHATGGPGMQAVFLVSGQGSCGTGVFLPQKAGTKSTSKPGLLFFISS